VVEQHVALDVVALVVAGLRRVLRMVLEAMSLDVVALVVAGLRRVLRMVLEAMSLDILVDPSLAILFHGTFLLSKLPEPEHLTEFEARIFHGSFQNAMCGAILRG
jgi:hypothetical protein